ncbi:MAG: bifunctional oligoribonuclease/PAP phosphatase NrnA [Anaerolineae bacterium]|nr:bifunctional oligoribonuclease/PAP phosphatase NrnA [Anaerolineae bacterium]
MTLWQEIIWTIQNKRNFIITSHVNPDCDALGSELVLAEHLRHLGKQVAILNSDATPTAFRFLDPQKVIKKYSQTKHATLIKKADSIVVLDASGGWERVGRVGEALAQSKALKICIDHHADPADFVDLAVVDATAAATAELIYELLLAMGGSLSANMAQSLYAAIITDTGNFRFPKTSPRTHRITAELLAAGANPIEIYRQVYEQYSLGRVRLKGHVLDSIKTAANGQIAYYGLDRATLKAYGVKISELDGFAGLGQEIGGVRVVVFGVERTKGRVKISLRSDGSVAINHLAAAYNGGGHPSAAGALVEGNLAEIMAETVEKVSILLAQQSQDAG